MIKLAVTGAQGRMGQSITQLALDHKDSFGFDLRVLLESPNRTDLAKELHGIKVSTNLDSLQECDVLIDFTIPDATRRNIEACVKYNVGMVIGTTGLQALDIDCIKQASLRVPIVFSSNMSLGVNVFFSLIEQVAKTIGGGIKKITIDETHHVHKKDSPSGTAKTMREYAEEGSGVRIADADMKSHRIGEVIGNHTIVFETLVDTITITHHAKTRDMFAIGSLMAAQWLVKQNKRNGLYNMKDVFGLK